MVFDISEFRSRMQQDGARSNLFQVIMPIVGIVAAIAPNAVNAGQDLTFKAKATTLPGSTMGTAIEYYQGREVKFWGNRSFPEWTMTIINDEDYLIRRVLEQWMNGGNSHVGNVRNPLLLSPDSYTLDCTVNHLGKTENIIKTYQFIGMFPVELSPMDMDWASNDSIQEYTATFQYQLWTDVVSGVF